MAAKRTAGRPRGKAAPDAARPAADPTVKLTVRMPASLRWRLRSYAADQHKDVDALVRQLVERELSGWYTARRGAEPDGAGEGEGPRVRYVG